MNRLLDVCEERTQRVEIPRRERIEFVIVALRTTGRLTQPRRADRAHAIGHHARFIVLGLGTALLGRQQQPVEGRADARLLVGVRQQVAGNLLDREPIERLVVVESSG